MGISNEKSPKWVLLQHLKAQNKNFLQEVETKAKQELQVADSMGFWRFKRYFSNQGGHLGSQAGLMGINGPKEMLKILKRRFFDT